MGNETAVKSVSIFPIPSNETEKLLPNIGNQEASAEIELPVCERLMSETASVATELNNANAFALLSSLMKKESKPVTKGMTINKTGIILYFYLQLFRKIV